MFSLRSIVLRSRTSRPPALASSSAAGEPSSTVVKWWHRAGAEPPLGYVRCAWRCAAVPGNEGGRCAYRCVGGGVCCVWRGGDGVAVRRNRQRLNCGAVIDGRNGGVAARAEIGFAGCAPRCRRYPSAALSAVVIHAARRSPEGRCIHQYDHGAHLVCQFGQGVAVDPLAILNTLLSFAVQILSLVQGDSGFSVGG